MKKASKAEDKISADPLLEILCGKRTRSSEIQNLPGSLWPQPCRYIGSNHLRKQDEYSISADLPLLGPRLLILQEFNLRQRPRGFWALWRDRRDKPKWYTFWVVLIVGGFTIVLSIVQIALSTAQLAVSIKPPTGPD
ncbi:hypothetical protein B0T17DRAFT_531001 [Bombardia bombarda]|uniref:Uncharacterized protein n=1 Tax=Bombardia bombarda TaxID=252184 RepID=A0AA39X003_9PEZI|nr:hypothetical protein B0T17DRAFT_531001 [Bombardia bombarda]